MTSQLRTVSTNLGPATVLPTEYFLDHILPPLHSSIDLKKVIQKLKTYGRKSHRPITKAGRWWGFPKNPQDVDHYEGRTAYQHFPRIVRAIAKCGAPKGVKPGLQFVLDPEYQNEPDERQEATLPNAYMVPPEMDASSARWMEISVFGEYDKYRTAEQHNVRKLCWSLSQAFNDPRRRFVFAYTIENHRMRVWFCDKTQLLVSEFFDFTADYNTVSRVFLSLLFAEPYQLGWDVSVNLVETLESGVQYDYVIQNSDHSTSTFRTLELLSASDRAVVLGGGTRIWKVLQVIDGVLVGEPMVLKDVWIHAELEREGFALEKIRLSSCSSDFQESVSANFLTVVCHGDVSIRPRKGYPYRDRTLHHVGNAEAYLQGKPLPDPPANISPSPPSIPFSEGNPLSGCRIHYRIVFKEICRPLTLSTPFHVAFPVLAQICSALKLMHTAGWVHRDVSVGNILIDESGHARLVDLEYAKRMGDDLIPEFRVGTSPFIANEVEAQRYICVEPSPASSFSTVSPSPPGMDMSLVDAMHLRNAQMMATGSKSPSPKSPTPEYPKTPPACAPPPDCPPPLFRHNPLHDLESMFWIAAYFLFKTANKGAEAAAIARQERATRGLFYDALQRCFCIQDSTTFTRNLRALHTSVQPAGLCLDTWRSELGKTFYSAEKDCSHITCAVAAGLHESLSRALLRIAKLMMEPPVHMSPRNRKRVLQDVVDSSQGEVLRRSNKKARTFHQPLETKQ